MSGGASKLRLALKRVGPLRSLYHMLLTARDISRTQPERLAQEYDAVFVRQTDPWNYAAAGQQARYRRALQLVDEVLAARPRRIVLEIGCGEGMFTELLAPRCTRLLATDGSAAALDRARRRLAGFSNVEVRHHDIVAEGFAGRFDLIVMDHVIDLFARRSAYRAVARRLAEALAPDGVVLLGAQRAFELAERAWWSRYVLCGGVAILAWIGRNTPLAPVKTVTESFYTYTLFRRRT